MLSWAQALLPSPVVYITLVTENAKGWGEGGGEGGGGGEVFRRWQKLTYRNTNILNS